MEENEEIHQAHLSKVLNFLRQKSNVDGFKTIRNAIEIQVLRNIPMDQARDRKKVAIMCTHCFTYWKEGKFSVKYKPKYKTGKNISKRMILKCLVCNHKEYQSYDHRTTDGFSIERRKIEPVTKKNKAVLKPKSKQQRKQFATSKSAKKTKNNTNKQSKNKSKQNVKKKKTR